MWIATLKPGENITVGDAEIVVLEVGRNRTRIGVNAAKHIPIRRGVGVLPIEREGPEAPIDPVFI